MGEVESRARGLGGELQTALGTAAGFLGGALITKGIGKVGEFLNVSTEKAKEAQQVDAQLDAVLKSTSVAFDGAATKAVFHATAMTGHAGAVSASAKEVKAHDAAVAKASAALPMATAHLHDMTAAYQKAKVHTEVQTLALSQAQTKVASLSATISQGAAVVESTKGATGYWEEIPGKVQITKDAVVGLAESLSKVTRNSKDEVLTGENMLLTFTDIGKDVFPEATRSLLDMATAMSGGARPGAEQLKETAIQLGKALNDPVMGITALHRVGVAFTDQQKELIKSLVATGDAAGAQRVIIKELATEFGGSAEAAGKTAAGQADILAHSFGAMQVKVGDVLLNLQSKLMVTFGPFIVGILSAFANVLGDPAITNAIDSIGSALTIAGKAVTGFLSEFNNAQSGGGAKDIFAGIANGLASVSVITGIPIFDKIAGFFATLSDLAPKAQAVIQTVIKAFQTGDFGPVLVMLKGWGVAFLSWMTTDVIPFIGARVTELASTIGTWVSNNVPILVAKLKDWAGTFLGWIDTDVTPFITSRLNAIWFEISSWISLQGVLIGIKINEWVQAFSFWITVLAQDMPGKLMEIGNAVGVWIATAAKDFTRWMGEKAIPAFIEWIKDAVPKLIAALPAISQAIYTWMIGIPLALTGAFLALGVGLINGMITGIGGNLAQLRDYLFGIISSIIIDAAAVLGITLSPHLFNNLQGMVNSAPSTPFSANEAAPHGAPGAGGFGGAGGGAATVNVHLDGQLIGQAMGTIVYNSNQGAYGTP